MMIEIASDHLPYERFSEKNVSSIPNLVPNKKLKNSFESSYHSSHSASSAAKMAEIPRQSFDFYEPFLV